MLLLALPATASAGTIDYEIYESGSVVQYIGSPGEENDVTFGGTAHHVRIHDAGAPIVPSPGVCETIDEHTVTCDAEDEAEAYLFDGDDRARILEGAWAGGLDGGEGDDDLRSESAYSGIDGGPGADVLVGSDGRDFIDGGGGPDRVDGRGGDDHLNGDGKDASSGTDVVDGGPGRDSIGYGGHHHPVTIDLRGTTGFGEAGENDTVRDVEDAFGGEAPDRIFGDGGPNALRGGGGSDLIRSGGGNDLVWVNQRRRPRGDVHLKCGRGNDVIADMSSSFLVPDSCERVRTQNFVVSTNGFRTGASQLAVRVKQRPPRYGARIRCRAVVELAGPYRSDAAERPPAIGTGIARAPTGRAVSVRVRLDDRGRSLLSGPGRTRVQVAVDGEDSCHGPPHGRPHLSFTLML